MRAVHLVPAAAVLVALGAIGGVAQLGHPATAQRPATQGPASSPAAIRQVPVTSAARACPPAPGGGAAPVALLAAGSSTAGSSTAGSSTAGSSTAGHGPADQVELTALPPVGLPVRAAGPVRAQSPGALALLTLPAAKATGKQAAGKQAAGQQAAGQQVTQPVQGWSVAGGGAMAQGLEAELTQDSGVASVRCAEPGSDLWFLGPGQQNGGSQVQLDLMNVDSTAASVDVSVINDGGQVEAGNDNGITVPPHQTVTESLSSVARGSGVLAIEVHTSIGRVAADVSAESHGVTSWLPGTAAPSTRLVIPGVPPSGSTAGLFLADPGPSTAKVTLTAITPQGHISPFGSQSVDLPGQSASYVALSPLGGTTAALQITSNVPVTGAVVVPGSSGPGVLTAATAPISEQAIVAGNTSGAGLAASVLLSAPGAAARVRLTEIAPASRTGANGTSSVTASQVVSVKAGHTLAAAVKAPNGAKHDSAFALVITPLPGSGPLYAARVETQDRSSVVSIIPAASALSTISLPPVRDSYDAISPP
jgi:Family of unknown function (DUF5719)